MQFMVLLTTTIMLPPYSLETSCFDVQEDVVRKHSFLVFSNRPNVFMPPSVTLAGGLGAVPVLVLSGHAADFTCAALLFNVHPSLAPRKTLESAKKDAFSCLCRIRLELCSQSSRTMAIRRVPPQPLTP